MVRIKRVYDPPSPDDGERILVDRLWPRGLTRAAARIDVWLRDIAPSDSLRRWFHADYRRWSDFRRRYRKELSGHGEIISSLKHKAVRQTLTFLTAARDPEHSHVTVLEQTVSSRRRRDARRAPVRPGAAARGVTHRSRA